MNSKGQDHGEFLRYFYKKCSYVSEERAASFFRMTEFGHFVSGITGRRDCVHCAAVQGGGIEQWV